MGDEQTVGCEYRTTWCTLGQGKTQPSFRPASPLPSPHFSRTIRFDPAQRRPELFVRAIDPALGEVSRLTKLSKHHHLSTAGASFAPLRTARRRTEHCTLCCSTTH